MKNRAENLLNQIGRLMQENLSKRNYDSVTKMSMLLSKVQGLQRRAVDLDSEISQIELSLANVDQKGLKNVSAPIMSDDSDAADEERASIKTLRIEVDWKMNGKNLEKEVVFFPVAAVGFAKFVNRMVEVFGQDALKKLIRIRINRGQLLSKTPETDFLNKAQGKVYGHKRLLGTEYYILTHSPTLQKADDIDRICRVLGLVPGSVKVQVKKKADFLTETYI